MHFKGENFDRGASVDDYRVRLELTECQQIELSSTSVSCMPPDEEPPVDRTGVYQEGVLRVYVRHIAGWG